MPTVPFPSVVFLVPRNERGTGPTSWRTGGASPNFETRATHFVRIIATRPPLLN